jgi:hypothetical protein
MCEIIFFGGKKNQGYWFQSLKITGWSELAATNALDQDEAVQAVLGMNQNTSSSPAQRFFSPLLCPKIFLSYLLPAPPPTSLTSFPAHSISKAKESSQV